MEIIPSSERGQALQASIQKELAQHAWSAEDDTVMAEYCLVMLGNRKTADQISTELADLIGADFDPAFVTWLFAEVAKQYTDAPVESSTATALASEDTTASTSAANDGRSVNDRRASARGNGVFSQAMSGVKRDARGLSDGRDQVPNVRARYEQRPTGASFEGIPAGPKNPAAPARDNRRNGAGRGGNIFDRVQPAINPSFGAAVPAGYDNIQATIDAVIANVAHPSALASIPFNVLQSHPQAAFLNPQVLAQAQVHAMAQAQAFAAMQGQQLGWPGFNGASQSFNPGFNVGYPGQQQQRQQFPPPHLQNQHQPPPQQPEPQSQPQQSPYPQEAQPISRAPPTTYQSKKYIAAPPLPSKPVEDQICKHGVDCTKASCPYSHPSPVATKDSGLVLSGEACDKQLLCTDKDCPKSHVSVAQLKAPIVSTATPLSAAIPIRAPPPHLASTTKSVTIDAATSIPGAGEKSCKFANACTRVGCVFLHPWDARGGDIAVLCRWAIACTRADCHFSHPPGRPYPRSSANRSMPKPYAATKSATSLVNNPAIGAWPTTNQDHISDRLKRFGKTVSDGEVERIIPGADGGQDEKVLVEVEGGNIAPKKEGTAV